MRLAAQAHQIGRHVQAPASTAVRTADSAERPRALQDTAAWALQYLLLQLAAVGLAALLQAYLGAPPWTLRYDGDPLVTLSHVSLWTSLVSGVADLLTGELTQNYASAAHAGGYVAIWLATCLVQGICVTLDAVPPLATVLVALGCQVVAVAAHTALADVRQWPYTPTAAYLRAFGTLRWGFAAMLLLATCSPGTISSAPRLLGYVAGVQALWQLFTWAQALHSSVLQVFGLHTVCFLATHAVCVRATWSAAGLGWAHAAVGVYTCWALSAAVCEARFPLPHLAEEVNTRIWARLNRPQINPLYTVTPILAALDLTVRLSLGVGASSAVGAVVLLGAHLLLAQCGVWAVRGWRYHAATAINDVIERASGMALLLDALCWGVLHALLLSSMRIEMLPA